MLYFDFVEFYGGPGRVSRCMFDLGHSVVPLLDLAASRQCNMADAPLLECHHRSCEDRALLGNIHGGSRKTFCHQVAGCGWIEMCRGKRATNVDQPQPPEATEPNGPCISWPIWFSPKWAEVSFRSHLVPPSVPRPIQRSDHTQSLRGLI